MVNSVRNGEEDADWRSEVKVWDWFCKVRIDFVYYVADAQFECNPGLFLLIFQTAFGYWKACKVTILKGKKR